MKDISAEILACLGADLSEMKEIWVRSRRTLKRHRDLSEMKEIAPR